MSRRKPALLLMLLLPFTLMLPTTASAASSLDDLLTETTVAATEAPATGPTVAPTDEQQIQETQAAINETLSDSSSDFARQLANTANLSKATTGTTAFSQKVNAVCTVLFQYLASIIAGLYLVTVGIDMLYIMVPPVRSFIANGYMGNATPDSNQAQAGVSAGAGMTGGMYGGGMYGGGGYNGMNRNMANMNAQAGMQGMNTAAQNQPALGRIQFVSNAALNAVAEESSSKKSALIDYMKTVAVSATLSVFILIVAASGILARIGAWLAIKLIGFLNGGLSNAI